MSLSARTLATLSFLLLVGCPKEIPIPVDPPVARKDYAQTPVNTPVTLSPLANDHDPNAEVMTILAIGAAAHGTAVIGAGDTVDYTPNLGYLGADSFTVTIVDASGNEVTETAYISVGPSVRFLYFSNFEDYFTRQLYLADLLHPGVGIPVNHYLRITAGPNITESTVETYTLSPDRTHVVYLADDSDESNARNAFVIELTHLGVATQVTDFEIGEGTSVVSPPQLTPDNAYVLYMSNEFTTLDKFEPVLVEIANPSNKFRVAPALTVNQTLRNPRITPDGSRLIYVLDDDVSGFTKLMSVEFATPGVAAEISGTPTPATSGVLDLSAQGGMGYEFVTGTTELIYPAFENGSTTTELWKVDWAAPAAPVKISGHPTFVGVLNFHITNDGTQLVYTAPELNAGQTELFLASIATPGPSVRLNTPRTGNFTISSYAVGQDSTYAVYLGDEGTADVAEIWKVDFAAPGVATKLNPTLATDEDVRSLGVSAGDPRTILYSSFPDPLEPGDQQVTAIDVDTPGVGARVGPTLRNAGLIVPIFAPDGQSVLYSADPTNLSVISMFAMQLGSLTQNDKITPERYSGAQVSAVAFLP